MIRIETYSPYQITRKDKKPILIKRVEKVDKQEVREYKENERWA